MQIVSASRRTDIPAFYAPWLMSRLRQGWAQTRNPFNPRQITTVDLRPQEVACLAFWTKDPRPLLPFLSEIDDRGFRYLFHVTLTGLPRFFEPRVPDEEAVAGAIRELSRRLGSERVTWRFDPLLMSARVPEKALLCAFDRLAGRLEGAVRRVVISFFRSYPQALARLRRAGEATTPVESAALPPEAARERTERLAAALAVRAARHGMSIAACAEPLDLASCGVGRAACIDGALIERLWGLSLPRKKDPGQRRDCRCLRSVDIGAYGSCRHGCLYCYAATGRALAGGAVHDPDYPMLLRDVREGEV